MRLPIGVMALLAAGTAWGGQPPARSRTMSPQASSGLVFGTVQTVAASQRRLVVALQSGKPGARVAVDCLPETQVVRSSPAAAAELKVGDTVQVTGTPLVIEARDVSFGDPAALRPADAPRTAPGGTRQGEQAPARPQASPLARLTGKVTRLAPLTIALPEGITAEVRPGARTRFLRVATVELSAVKPGERVMAFGPRSADGSVKATRVQLGDAGYPIPPRPAGRSSAEKQPAGAPKR